MAMEMKKKGSNFPSNSQDEAPLCLELMTEILLRVEAKSVLRFRCVSKTWRRIIDDPKFHFMRLPFLKNHPFNKNKHGNGDSDGDGDENDIILITLEDKRSYTYCGTKFTLRSSSTLSESAEEITPCASVGITKEVFCYHVFGCVYGLFLLQLCQHYILWNPFTRRSFPLRRPPLFHDHKNLCHTNYSLGFDPSVGDFKVVALRCPRKFVESPTTVVGVYSCSTDCWKTCSFDFDNKWISKGALDYQRSVFGSGAVNWLRYDEIMREYTHIVSFDLSSEALNFFTLPEDDYDGGAGGYYGGKKIRFLFSLGESLAIFDVTQIRRCIWVMERGGGEGMSWTKWYSNDLPDVDIDRYEFFNRVSQSLRYNLLFLEKSRKFLVAANGKVYSYDIESHERQTMEKSNDCRIFYMDFYMESLALLCAKGVTGDQILRSLSRD